MPPTIFRSSPGRICPAPCEAACVLGINEPPVTIKVIEKTIIEHAFHEGWIQPEPPLRRTGKRVAVVGSGPAGLAAAQQLNRAGHSVMVFEKADRIGGLLRYGIPEFKMEKWVLDRRLEQLLAEGVEFSTNVHVGHDSPAPICVRLRRDSAGRRSRASPQSQCPGRELKGIHFAMEFLPQQNKRCAGDDVPNQILATGKHVVIIGGGDTGADCLGTSHRQKAASVYQFELLPLPPPEREPHTPGRCGRCNCVSRARTKRVEFAIGARHHTFTGDEQGHVKSFMPCASDLQPKFEPIPGTEFTMDVTWCCSPWASSVR